MAKNNVGFETETGAEAMQDTEGLVFNLGETEENTPSFEVLPKGTYDAIVEEFEYKISNSGNPMIQTVYTIVGGEYDGRKVFDYYLLVGEGAKWSLPRLKQLMIRCCPDVDITEFNPSRLADSGSIIGRACRLALKITTQKDGEYKGTKRNNVVEVLASEEMGSFM